MFFSRSQGVGCQCQQCQPRQQGWGRPPVMQPSPQRQQMQNRQQMPAYQPQRQQPPQQMHPMMPMQPPQQQGKAPYSDPSVRFEPIPEGMLPPGMTIPTTAEAPAKPSTDTIKNFLQGEVNSLAFYEKLSKVSETYKERVLELISHKKSGNPLLLQANVTEETKVDEVDDFASGISHALLQESRQLREMTKIKDGSITPVLLANKIADIAHLMSLQ
ncbi:MAG: hypothetical protein FWD97_01555 [Defluviitaleaceae bacterium]|nr:hypothetical protein [Defluviitaleaceae bacterium]